MKPNILFIISDQLRPDMLGCSGHPAIRTPHLDMLSKEGVLFNRAYTDCPICIPARTTMITGIQSHRYGMPSFAPEYRIDRERDQFLGAIMTRAGYQTRLIGKTHWHTEHDCRAGYECVISTDIRHQEHLRKYGHSPSPGIGMNELTPMLSNCPEEMQDTNWCVQKGIDFLDQEHESDQPFFLCLSMEDPHPANVAREPYYSMYDHEPLPEPVNPAWAGEDAPYALKQIRYSNAHENMNEYERRKAQGVYYGKVTNIDHQLGRLFGTLMRKGLWDNTIVVFTADHGEMLFDYGTCFKATFLDPAARLPFMMRFPAAMQTLRGAQIDALVELADLLPTFCEIAEVKPPEDITGKSMMPLVTGEKTAIRETMHGQIDNSHMFIEGNYKYLYFADDGVELLFDKSVDPMDEFNLAADESLIAPIREHFIAHLAAENSSQLSDGRLLNLHKTDDDVDKYSSLSWKALIS
jgi:arylsulfatase A-like enzyme